MTALVREKDWSKTPLGPIEHWPQSLTTAVDIALACSFPMAVLWGPDLIQIYNDGYREIMAAKHPSGLGQATRECWPEGWRLSEPIYAHVRSGETVTFEDSLYPTTRHGYLEDAWFTLCYSPIHDEADEVGGILVTAFETTQRLQAEAERKRAQATKHAVAARQSFLLQVGDRLRSLSESQTIMATAAEMLGRHLDVGRCGYSEVDKTGEFFTVERDWTDGKMASMVGTFRLSDFGEDIIRDFRAGKTVQVEDPLSDVRTQGAEAAYVSIGQVRSGIGVPLIKNGRFVAGFYVHQTAPRHWTDDEVSLVEDVAERTWEAVERARTEKSLRKSEQRLRALTLSSNDMVYRMSPDWSEMRQLDGRDCLADTEEPTYDWPDNYIHPDDQSKVQAAINKAMRNKRVFELEHRVQREDGSLGWAFSRAAPLLNEVGEIVEWIGSASDITDRKRTSIALQNANRTKDEFLAMLSHELRNPLAPIVTALQLMRMHDSDALLTEREVIEQQVQHLVDLVDDLLDVARIARGKVELQKAPTDISEIVARAIETANPLLDKHEQIVQMAIDKDLVVEGDARRLVQVVTNLLTNAAKYSARQGTIHVSATAEDSQAVLRVRDEGIGIEPDLLPYIFDLFSQSAQSVERSEGGLGLGLALVRNLVTLHGGSVEARSEGRDCGSEFIIRLPLLEERRIKKRRTSHKKPDLTREAASAQSPNQQGGLKVLIVDDYTDAADSLAELLKLGGYPIQVAYDGAAALEAAAEFQPAVALVDIGLPIIDGYEVARRLRQMPGLEKLVLVAVTGYGQKNDRRRAKEAGFDEHLVKPLDPMGIGALIERIAASKG